MSVEVIAALCGAVAGVFIGSMLAFALVYFRGRR